MLQNIFCVIKKHGMLDRGDVAQRERIEYLALRVRAKRNKGGATECLVQQRLAEIFEPLTQPFFSLWIGCGMSVSPDQSDVERGCVKIRKHLGLGCRFTLVELLRSHYCAI
ncbi:hypothetical protein FSB08_27190 [Paraburkholderia sp. JPY432]|uniref:hypothetical protein n=1 Tax=Paraburkholderia youngii TaxID=2782701 RepID=UPI0015959826|nr:hypothetical protein [Paraburkholderia youngii]NVH76111.1 hypothetical protein [Paraburkholderia youngii]